MHTSDCLKVVHTLSVLQLGVLGQYFAQGYDVTAHQLRTSKDADQEDADRQVESGKLVLHDRINNVDWTVSHAHCTRIYTHDFCQLLILIHNLALTLKQNVQCLSHCLCLLLL